MGSWQTVTWRAAGIGRWIALLFGSLMVLFLLALVFGEGPPRFSSLSASEKLQFLAMGALFLGLAVAWKWEGAGGFLSVAGFAGLVVISITHLRLWAFDIPAAVGVVHIFCWWRLRAGPPAGLAPWHLSRNLIVGIAGLLAVFLILSANEIFGQPPIMTPQLHPSTGLLGAWTQAAPVEVALTIHPDATVTGNIDGADVTEARIDYGRSWFGKWMHWNADYVIRGRLAGGDFTAALMANPRGLRGAFTQDGRPVRLNLRKSAE